MRLKTLKLSLSRVWLQRFLVGGVVLVTCLAARADLEKKKYENFLKLKEDAQVADAKREKSHGEWNESEEKYLARREKERLEFLEKYRAEASDREATPQYKKFLEDRAEHEEKYERNRQDFMHDLVVIPKVKLSEEDELAVMSNRPRYRQNRRALYGAKIDYKKKNTSRWDDDYSSGGGYGGSNYGGGSSYGGSYGGSSGGYQSRDHTNSDAGYSPPSFVPPPPPPPIPAGDEVTTPPGVMPPPTPAPGIENDLIDDDFGD